MHRGRRQASEVTSFPQSVKLEPDETVIFAWIVFESRAHRDRVNGEVMKDPRIANFDPKSMPFDGKRMSGAGSRSWSRLERRDQGASRAIRCFSSFSRTIQRCHPRARRSLVPGTQYGGSGASSARFPPS
jgi:hypothetical protein